MTNTIHYYHNPSLLLRNFVVLCREYNFILNKKS